MGVNGFIVHDLIKEAFRLQGAVGRAWLKDSKDCSLNPVGPMPSEMTPQGENSMRLINQTA
jgi:hypothetical protein